MKNKMSRIRQEQVCEILFQYHTYQYLDNTYKQCANTYCSDSCFGTILYHPSKDIQEYQT